MFAVLFHRMPQQDKVQRMEYQTLWQTKDPERYENQKKGQSQRRIEKRIKNKLKNSANNSLC